MIGCGTTTFTDPDAYRVNVPDVSINLVLTGGSDFKASMSWANFSHVRLARGKANVPHIDFVTLAPERVFVSFSTRRNPPLIWNGVELLARDIVFHDRGGRFHQRTSGAGCWGSISLAPKDLTDYGSALAHVALKSPEAAKILRPPSVATAALLRLHAQACVLAETKPDLLAHREVARAIEQELIHALVNCLTGDEMDEHAGARLRCSGIMVQFEHVLGSFDAAQPTTAELCVAMDLAERTLRMCCSEILGMSPGQYARLRRLNLVRAALQRADAATVSIADIAGKYGFSELGRFAAAYRGAFGETPSATLRQGRLSVSDAATEFA